MIHQGDLLRALAEVRVFVLDIDGVLTDGMLIVQEDGELLRRMNIKDGYALQLAIKKGYKVWVISGGHSVAVQKRLKGLGVEEVFIKVGDKGALLQKLIEAHGYEPDRLLYMGDDMPDIEPMILCGVRACPHDAAIDVKKASHYISPQSGGQGCVRDVIEKVLRLNDDWC